MIAAGHETTAGALLWASYAIVRHPNTQTRLGDEILDMLAETPTPDYVEIEGLNEFLAREAIRDVVMKGVLILKGTTVMAMPAAIQLHPRIRGDDAEEFNPDRWERKPVDSHAFAAFLQGPRLCVGQVFSRCEFKIIPIELLSKFRFEATPETGEDCTRQP
ncbi:cytochrome P450 [Podospora didyma]|uniref:Cytochrome P450 n=1 Tax=Podospora didyma TaxID=330526 RepID=A0AAE0NSG8_9PEZI|nr:cytochrome P450 [Podospora didyma]